jgi:hypothetical protein
VHHPVGRGGDEAEHLIADGVGRDLRSDGLDDTREVSAQRDRKQVLVPLLEATRADRHVGRVDRRADNPHEDLVVAGVGLCDLTDRGGTFEAVQ